MKHRTTTSLLAALGSVLLLAPLPGCRATGDPAADEPVVDTSGPPPEGYATWEDYWKAKDREYRDFEHDVNMLELKRQRTPGAPR